MEDVSTYGAGITPARLISDPVVALNGEYGLYGTMTASTGDSGSGSGSGSFGNAMNSQMRKDLGYFSAGIELATFAFGIGEATLAGDAIRLHHAWPKYLGGAAKQDLVPLTKSLHDAYHSGLDKILPRQWGTTYYEGLSQGARGQMLEDLGAYTNAFDAKYGTELYDAMLRNGFTGK